MGLSWMTQVGSAMLTGIHFPLLCAVCKVDAWPQPLLVQKFTRVLDSV